jgi:hypothetical protein
VVFLRRSHGDHYKLVRLCQGWFGRWLGEAWSEAQVIDREVDSGKAVLGISAQMQRALNGKACWQEKGGVTTGHIWRN